MKRFVGEEIEVVLGKGDFLEKRPECPQRFKWSEHWVSIEEMRSSWQDFSRKGDFARNMKDKHLERAQRTGSWGVGRFYFEVLGADGGVYVIYYDRAPENARDRKGKWYLFTMDLD